MQIPLRIYKRNRWQSCRSAWNAITQAPTWIPLPIDIKIRRKVTYMQKEGCIHINIHEGWAVEALYFKQGIYPLSTVTVINGYTQGCHKGSSTQNSSGKLKIIFKSSSPAVLFVALCLPPQIKEKYCNTEFLTSLSQQQQQKLFENNSKQSFKVFRMHKYRIQTFWKEMLCTMHLACLDLKCIL